MKTCPYCAEEIQDAAKVCRFCQRDLSTPMVAETPATYSKRDRYCQSCGTIARPKRRTRGSFAIEVILWLCFLVPGLIYSVWRLTTTADACPKCGSYDVIPLDSPKARAVVGNRAGGAAVVVVDDVPPPATGGPPVKVVLVAVVVFVAFMLLVQYFGI